MASEVTGVESATAVLEDKSALEDDLLDDFDNDPFMQNYREKRMQQLKDQLKELEEMKQNDHGEYTDLPSEKDFLTVTTKEKKVICHFYKNDFQRCKIVDKHLAVWCSDDFFLSDLCRFLQRGISK